MELARRRAIPIQFKMRLGRRLRRSALDRGARRHLRQEVKYAPCINWVDCTPSRSMRMCASRMPLSAASPSSSTTSKLEEAAQSLDLVQMDPRSSSEKESSMLSHSARLAVRQ